MKEITRAMRKRGVLDCIIEMTVARQRVDGIIEPLSVATRVAQAVTPSDVSQHKVDVTEFFDCTEFASADVLAKFKEAMLKVKSASDLMTVFRGTLDLQIERLEAIFGLLYPGDILPDAISIRMDERWMAASESLAATPSAC
jgi:hypothetical protein